MLSLPGSIINKESLADWIEVRLLFSEATTLSLPVLSDWLDEDGTLSDLDLYDEAFTDLGQAEDDLVDQDEAGVRRRLRQEDAEGVGKQSLLAEEALLELEYRATVVGDTYPIRVTHGLARRAVESWRDCPVYAFLTALNARYLYGLDANLNMGARLFERLVVPALKRYWGGEAAHFGWPRSQQEEANFRAALPRLAHRIGERLIIEPSRIPTSLKDLEVDAIAWRPVDDRRGQTVMLCQCAIGDDWDKKGIRVGLWAVFVNFAVEPTIAIAFPFVPPAVRRFEDIEVEWMLLCGKGGVPFDRLRLAHLVQQDDLDSSLAAGIIQWTSDLAPVLRRSS